MKPDQITLDLIAHHGGPFTQNDLSGRFSLVYFGFLHCKVVCPRSLKKISRVLDILESESNAVRALYITVDPERDTPEAMKNFLEGFDARITGLTGAPAEIERAKSSFRVFSQKMEDPDDRSNYLTPHTAFIYLVSPNARYIAHYTELDEPTSIASSVLSTILRSKSDQ